MKYTTLIQTPNEMFELLNQIEEDVHYEFKQLKRMDYTDLPNHKQISQQGWKNRPFNKR